MALDDEDIKAIGKMVNEAITNRLVQAERKSADALTTKLEEVIGAKLAEAAKAKAAEADKAAPLEEERKTVRQRIEALEKERDQAKAEAKQQRVETAFRKAWQAPKFVAALADDHMAALEKAGRLQLGEDGTVRVIDPKKHKDETHPTVDEYVAELAKSDMGKHYQGARTSAGQGATAANGAATGPKQPIPNAVMGLMTGNFSE